ncbi:MAG: efflux RND transporter periplasmic adaptor subunit [Pseudomonadota bacterium]
MIRFPSHGFAAALPLVAALALAAVPAQAQQGRAGVLVDRVVLSEVLETTPVLAQVVATVESSVATRTAGVVDTVSFRVGDRVEAGAELVRLDVDLILIRQRTARAALDAAQAGIEVAEARVRLATQAFRRQSQLRGSTAFSRGQFEDLEEQAAQARAELGLAQAEVGRAEAELASAEYDLRNATILAPFAGVVTERLAQPGAYIALGQAVATLIDTASLEIEVDLPVKLVPAIEEGMALSARAEETDIFEATVRSLLPVEDVSTRTRPVRLSADFAQMRDVRLAAGKSLVLDVPISRARSVVTVSKDALVQSRGGWSVFTVEDGIANPRRIEIGMSSGSRVEVRSGLLPGDVVVVRGNERLRPGQPVAPTMVETPDGASDPAETASVSREQG